MEIQLCELILHDFESYLSQEQIEMMKNKLEIVASNNCSEDVCLVALLHEITKHLDFSIHDHMCEQRGYMTSSFKTKEQLISYTSAEFAKERYNISEIVYNEILNLSSDEYRSMTKSKLKTLGVLK